MTEFVFPPPFKTKKQKVELLQEIVRPKCADLLRAHGFVSYKNEDLSWYRIFNGEVLQAVYFYSTNPSVPLMLRFSFGCHPLFLEPPIPHAFSNKGKNFRAPLTMFESIYWTVSLPPALETNKNRLTCSLPNEGEAEIIEKSASRTLSCVGRISPDLGTSSILPPNSPPVTLTDGTPQRYPAFPTP